MKRNLVVMTIVCVTVGIVLLLFGKNESTVTKTDSSGIVTAEEYRAELERICAFMCSSLEGIETANVNITLDGGMRCVYAKNSEGSFGGTYFSSGGEPLFLKYDYPEIKGCAVMCSGSVNSQTRLELTDMLCAYLGIKSNMIYIGYIG